MFYKTRLATVLTLLLDKRFRWTVCQLDSLGKCLNRAQLRKSLGTLPRTLPETYERILLSIDEYSDYASKILRWLIFSKRPLLVDEISEVVAIDPSRRYFDEDEILEAPEDVATICSSLVTITQEPNTDRQIVTL